VRLTEEQFEARAFFTLFEVVSYSGVEGHKVRRWLRAANVVTTNAGGARIVTRARLEGAFPELLEAIRRRAVMGLGGGHGVTRRTRRTPNGSPSSL
jgi:hypothetical protein